MRRVIIESPFGKNVDGTLADDETMARNVIYLKRCILDCLKKNEAPFASHGFYPQVLNDRDPEGRKLGMEAGFTWAEVADGIVVYEDYGVTPGMQAGIDRATKNAFESGRNIFFERRMIGFNP